MQCLVCRKEINRRGYFLDELKDRIVRGTETQLWSTHMKNCLPKSYARAKTREGQLKSLPALPVANQLNEQEVQAK